jgi:hypothetical protein
MCQVEIECQTCPLNLKNHKNAKFKQGDSNWTSLPPYQNPPYNLLKLPIMLNLTNLGKV